MTDGFDKSNIDFSELPELKPCPFCGNQFCAHEDHVFIETQGTKWGQVNCCNAEVRTGYGPLSDWIEDAIETWNTRPVEDALRQRIEELEAERNSYKNIAEKAVEEIDELQSHIEAALKLPDEFINKHKDTVLYKHRRLFIETIRSFESELCETLQSDDAVSSNQPKPPGECDE